MTGSVPSMSDAVRLAWSDLHEAARAHPLLALFAVAAGFASEILQVVAGVDEPDFGPRVVAILFLAALAEAFLFTPVLIALHRFVLLGEVTPGYAPVSAAPRFWRFFMLSAVLILATFMPALLARELLLADEMQVLILIVAVVVIFIASLWLALLFPAIAVDAPGATVVNAIADIRGHVLRMFWTGLIAVLPLLVASAALAYWAPLSLELTAERALVAAGQGLAMAAIYALLVVIASRFYRAYANRLTRPA